MGMKFQVATDLELIEYSHQGLTNIWGKGCFLADLKVKGHPYRPYGMRDDTWAEGYVLRHEGQDWKVKRVPTVERMWGDMPWESYVSDGKWVKLWPRPGKNVLPENKQKESLQSYVAVTMLNPKIQMGGSKDGECVKVGDVYNISVGGEVRVSSGPKLKEREVVSAKVVIFDNHRSYVLQEEGKMLDFVGGKIEIGETSLEALRRESKEDTGIVVAGSQHVGVVERNTQGVVFSTFLYVAPYEMNRHMKNLVCLDHRDYKGVTSWVPDFYDFLGKAVGPFVKMRGFWTRMSGRESAVRKKIAKVTSAEKLAYDIVVKRKSVSIASLRGRLRDNGYSFGRGNLKQLVSQPDSGLEIKDGQVVVKEEVSLTEVDEIDQSLLNDDEDMNYGNVPTAHYG